MSKRPQIKLPARATREPAEKPEPEPSKPPKRYIRASLYLEPQVHELLRTLAFERRRSQHELLVEAVHEFLERQSGKRMSDVLSEARE
jgi:hypothetical protein